MKQCSGDCCYWTIVEAAKEFLNNKCLGKHPVMVSIEAAKEFLSNKQLCKHPVCHHLYGAVALIETWP